MAETHGSDRLAVILHADIAGSTALVQQDEHLAHQRIQETFRRFSDTINKYHGHVRELRGDALLAEFDRASAAVIAALSFQADQIDYNAEIDDDIRPTVRVGIAMGEVIIADDTVTGEGVVLAQRVEQLAEPSGVSITGAIQEALPTRLPLDQDDLGEQQVKGFDKPIHVYSVRLKEEAALPGPTVASETKRTSAIQWIMVATVVVLICGGGLLAWVQPWKPDFEPAFAERMAFPLPDKPSIAVLAFDNLSQDEGQESLSDGISENIITALSHFSELFVIAKNSSFAYKGKPVNIKQVAEELGVRYVLEGSLQRSSDRVRISVRLIDALAGNHIWAQVYDRQLEDIFEIQDEIARTVASTVEEKVEVRERDRVMAAHPASLEAFEYWLRGTKHWFEWTEEGNDKAQMMYTKAVELDPNMARGYLGLAWVYINGFSHGWTELPRDEALERARELAQKGLELEPFDYFPYQTMGYVHMQAGEREQAIARFEKSLELNPNAGYPMMDLGEAMVYAGRAPEGIIWMKKAMRLNPHHPDWFYWNLSFAEYAAGRYGEALKAMNKMSSIPDRARHILAATYVRLGRLEEAQAEVKAILENDSNYSIEKLRLFFAGKYQDSEVPERYIEDLSKAGLPDNPHLKLPEKPSIAVLPFTNMSDDPKQEYFVDGMTEDLITDLSKISGLFVIARNSSFTYKGKAVNVKNVARDLGVRYVLEGSVRRAGSQVRINAQLIDATTGGHLWAERYDGVLEDIFALQDQVTQQIVIALAVNLTGEEEVQQTRHDTDNAESHDAFLQGWAHYKLETPEDLARSIPHFEEAIRLDPDYAQAHAALAAVYWDAYQNDWAFDLDMPSFRAERWANDHLEQALKAPTPLAHAVQSNMFASFGLQDQAIEEAEKAVALDHNNATAVAGLANALVLAERPDEGLKLIQDAMRLDPHYPPGYLVTLGAAYFGMENYEKAAETFERAVKRNPENELPRIYLASSYGHLGRINDAEEAIESANDLRASLGIGDDLSLERKSSSYYSPFQGEIDFARFGIKKAQERVRAGLSDIPSLTWQYLITVHEALGPGNTWFEIEGATKIDLATAKSFHDRGVLFIDVGTDGEGIWKKIGRVPGAVNLPWTRSPDDPTKRRLRQTTLSEIVDKTDEVVFYWWIPGSTGYPAFDVAKAVSWGYEKVYYFVGGIPAWKEAGYPVERDD